VYALSWLFLAVAVGSLLVGLSRAGLGLIFVSIGASVLAIAFLVAAVLRRSQAADDRPPGPEEPPTR
jgi:hypothetical protein